MELSLVFRDDLEGWDRGWQGDSRRRGGKKIYIYIYTHTYIYVYIHTYI